MSAKLKINRGISIATLSVCLFCSIPQDSFCTLIRIEQIANNLAVFNNNPTFDPRNIIESISQNEIIPNNSYVVLKNFEILANTIQSSENPLETTTQFFSTFLDRINEHYKNNTSFPEIFNLLRKNIDLVPKEYQEIYYTSIQNLEQKNNGCEYQTQLSQLSEISCAFYWPWEWNWFGFNKKKNKMDPKKIIPNLIEAAEINYIHVIAFGLALAALILVVCYNPAALPVATAGINQIAKTIFAN